MVAALKDVSSRMTKPRYRDTNTGTYKNTYNIIFNVSTKGNNVFLISTLTALSTNHLLQSCTHAVICMSTWHTSQQESACYMQKLLQNYVFNSPNSNFFFFKTHTQTFGSKTTLGIPTLSIFLTYFQIKVCRQQSPQHFKPKNPLDCD